MAVVEDRADFLGRDEAGGSILLEREGAGQRGQARRRAALGAPGGRVSQRGRHVDVGAALADREHRAVAVEVEPPGGEPVDQERALEVGKRAVRERPHVGERQVLDVDPGLVRRLGDHAQQRLGAEGGLEMRGGACG